MRSYVTNPEEENKFILNYKVKNDKIKVRYASNRTETLPLSNENEAELQSKMIEQIVNADDFYEKSIKECSLLINVETVTAAVVATSTIVGLLSQGTVETGAHLAFNISTLSFVVEALRMRWNLKNIEDIKKHRLFMKIKDGIDWTEHTYPFLTLSEKIQDFLIKRKGTSIDVNDIEKLSKKDLENIVNCISEKEQTSSMKLSLENKKN